MRSFTSARSDTSKLGRQVLAPCGHVRPGLQHLLFPQFRPGCLQQDLLFGQAGANPPTTNPSRWVALQYHLGGLGTSPLHSNEILAACANEGGTTANTLGENRITSLFSTRPNSSVVQIEVGLSVAYDPNPRIIYFDAWHSTTDGHVYKRSEQYSDRRFESPNIQNRWIWRGRRWVQDQYFNMVAQLSMNSRYYFYGEWNESTNEQLTDAVCNIPNGG